MIAGREQAGTRRPPWWVIAMVALAVLALILLVIRGLDPNGPGQSGDPLVTDTGSSAADDLPLTIEHAVELRVPETVRTPVREFEVDAGSSYLVSYDVTTEKPSDSPGSAMYLGASLSCTGEEDQAMRSIGGTQNVLNGQTVTLRNQFLLTAQTAGMRSCSLAVASPYVGTAAESTRVEIAANWRVSQVADSAGSADAGELLPKVIGVGEKRSIFRYSTETGEGGGSKAKVLSTVRATTCTSLLGSREGGDHLCPEDQIDEGGSEIHLTLQMNETDTSGRVCSRETITDQRVTVDKVTHHIMIPVDALFEMPADRCGGTLEFVLVAENAGPAPIVIHGTGSSFIVQPAL